MTDSYLKSNRGITKTPVIHCAPAGAAHLTSGGRTLVCLVRHGQTDWNAVRRLQGREAVPLNEKGIEPDEVVELTYEQINKNIDTQLDKAKSLLK